MGKRKKATTDSKPSEPSKKSKSNVDSTITKEELKKNKDQEQQNSLKIASPVSSASSPENATATESSLITKIATRDGDAPLKELSKDGTGTGSIDRDQVQIQDTKKTFSSSSSVVNTTTGTPKLMVPRAIIASGLVPRQVARAKPSPAKVPISTLSASIPASTVSGAALDTTKTIFRAKDITSHHPPSAPLLEGADSESLISPHVNNTTLTSFHLSSRSTNNGSRTRLRTFMRDSYSHSSNSSSNATSNTEGYEYNGSDWKEETHKSSTRNHQPSGAGASASYGSNSTSSSTTTRVIKTTTTGHFDTIIRAERIIARPENGKGQFAYPYGNYPNYYEKRTQEQTKGNARSKKSSVPPPSSPSSSSSSLPKPAKSRESPNHKRTDRWKTTPSVLFPSNTTLTENGSSPSMAELAKSVDLRLEFLEPSWFRGKKVLDIGCNAALLTVFIALHYKPHRIQGVDLDPSLIGKAQTFVLKTFSQISPQAYTQTPQTDKKKEKKKKERSKEKTKDEEDVKYEAYFPKALHRIHGFLPVPEKTTKTENLFPHNIEFRIADWATEQGNQEANAGQWDVILGFSLTKWIHLHHGDAGMKEFFQKVYRSLAPGGIFLLEPQAYDTYNRRSKITKEMEATYKSIVFRPEEFQEYLLSKDVGFKECLHLGHSDGQAKNFNRDIFLYRKCK
ncbi:hypothetical protein BGZ80_002257 [Entomortierella chlamydospora]|uniref:RNA methyltransferase n=1 Tax=Entomortierella chlamydospora TaxID=101097 RepID=A0A9P6MPN9_9FUNG|nr:hypothetical protein BGZ79_008857 [Entomortierella chlamydospora]KAG0009576.1 hypothetical protein BGZ80_002257 [Entomortierella chlamydospora]